MIKIGDMTTILKHDENPRGTGKIVSFDLDKSKFQMEWISPPEKKGQVEEVPYCWLLDVIRP